MKRRGRETRKRKGISVKDSTIRKSKMEIDRSDEEEAEEEEREGREKKKSKGHVTVN